MNNNIVKMTKGVLFTVLLTFACYMVADAQIDDDWIIPDGWIDQSNLDQFKKESNRQFNNFRDSANRRFAKALAKQWNPIELQKPVMRTRKPVPKVAPVAPKEKTHRKPVEIPAKFATEISFPIENPEIIKPHADVPVPVMPDVNTTTDFLFYGTTLSIVAPDQTQLDKCHLDDISEKSVASFWQQLTDLQFYDYASAILRQKEDFHLDSWGTYLVIKQYAAKLFPNDADKQTIAIIYLMTQPQLDYDAFIARTDKGLAMLLCNYETIYNTSYVKIYADSIRDTRHYLFYVDKNVRNYQGKIYTYSGDLFGSISQEASNFTTIFNEKTTPILENKISSSPYNYNSNGQNISFSINENLIQYLNDYPATELGVYANFPVSEDFSKTVSHDFQFLVTGKDTITALQNLLTYMQYGFEYATDDEQFGREKYFFCEENYHYQKNDCEDRSILFSYLVRRLLGLNVMLLQYDDHVVAAVQLPKNKVEGCYIDYEGGYYSICDPTYMGAQIGQIPDEYIQATAQMIFCEPIKK